MFNALAEPPELASCITISEAAALLGVTTATLRNWDRSDKLKAIRHPVNGYRLYPREEIETLLRTAYRSRRGRPSPRYEGRP